MRFFVLLVMLSSAAYAAPIDDDCAKFGFGKGIEKFEWEDSDYFQAEYDDSYLISVQGNASQASWTATPAVGGVVIKGAGNYFSYPGGTSGMVYSSDIGNKDISHVTFCTDNQIPEFGLFAAIAAAVGGAAVLYKRRTIEYLK